MTEPNDPLEPLKLLKTSEVSDLLQVPDRTLDQWAYLHKGPSYYRIGRHRRYRRSDVEAWLETNRQVCPE